MLAAMISDDCGFKCHWGVADYLQRSARHIASATDVKQAAALGATAVHLAAAGKKRRHAGHSPLVRQTLSLAGGYRRLSRRRQP